MTAQLDPNAKRAYAQSSLGVVLGWIIFALFDYVLKFATLFICKIFVVFKMIFSESCCVLRQVFDNFNTDFSCKQT